MRIIFSGRVQGVGFRHRVFKIAEELGVKGTVQNLSDGSVEVIALAAQETLEEFLERVRSQKGAASIDGIVIDREESGPYHDFRIL